MVGVLRQLLVGVVADRITLPRIRLEALDRFVDLVEPARPARRDREMAEHAPAARVLVHLVAGFEDEFLRQKPVLGDLRGRVRQDRDLGVAVQIDFLEIVIEFQIIDGLFLLGERLVPAGLADRLALLDEAGEARVVAQEMRLVIDDVLPRQRLRALLGQFRRRRLGEARLE